MAMSILLKSLTLKWNISKTIWRIEVGDGSFFCIFHALSFELNFVFVRRFPIISFCLSSVPLVIFHQHQPMVSMHLSSFAMPIVAQIIVTFIMPQGPSDKTSVTGLQS